MAKNQSILFASLILGLGCAAALGAGRATQPAKDPVKIIFPVGWAVQQGQGNTIASAKGPQDGDPGGQFQPVLTISVEQGAKVDGPAQQKQLLNGVPGYKVVDRPANITLNAGLTGVTFSGTFTSGKLNLYSRQYMFAQGGQIYVITFTCLASASDVYKNTIAQSVGTFSIAK